MGAVRDRSILIACIGAGSAIVAAFAKPLVEALTSDGPAPRPSAVAAAPSDAPSATAATPITPTPHGPPIEGTWKQYILSQDEGVVYLGTFVVARGKDGYVISPRTQVEGERHDNAIGVFDVSYDGQALSYNSNWGNGEIGNFEFHRVSPTIFEGEIRVAGKLLNRTRVVKIE